MLMKRLQAGCGLVLALTAGVIGSVEARECSGYNTHVTISADVTDLGKGHVLVTFRNHDIVVTDDPKDVLNMAMGECAGTMLTTPDGKTQAWGYCLRRDGEGNSQSIDWVLPLGAEKGSWKATGGTGKYADLKANGWWHAVVTDGGKQGVNRWGGTCSK